MSMKIKKTNDGRLMLWCPACKMGHWFDEKIWTFNRDMEKPTINPSLLVRYVRMPDPVERDEKGKCVMGDDGRIKGCKDMICHSFVKDGQIQFLNDCTHDKAGQTMELGDIN